ncbi:uncharacterized protein [Neodiprion pinetum]|uniref:Uncharacterized protein LOC107218978 n=1 Tax=Neodiprion lecontei TaxID=441921 RepID=A0A6J0BC61_NEOLC|nr:uncharacterized protein LOC107218978 [Neodiprion lecontei]XP_046432010.1 uncharacterized protein LOC124185366 [Neodiprion fabricii]XP_046488663.1 uncharacterized protein LOC124222101 [Neodiprion pinetum]XP_046625715.1 uncharacterized protein LOC124307740 [Neodiprion virginianus]
MSEAEAKPASPAPTPGNNPAASIVLQTPVLQVACRMLRSPSHESVTTDISLFSVSSSASEARGNRLAPFKSYSDAHLASRGPSPNPDNRQIQANRQADIPEILWFEEETELIRSCGALSSALGLQKSFSTSDVFQLPSPDAGCSRKLRSAVSALALDTAHRDGLLLEQARLDHASRSCSTWVAVGDVGTTSQLPSPHGGTVQPAPPAPNHHTNSMPFTAADLVRSVNKKVRQNYIRRRLLTTYRAMERLSQSEFNLDRLEAAASAAQSSPGATLSVPGTSLTSGSVLATSRKGKNLPLTVSDVERERGKQLSKYERNMMIFNWLHTLDDTAIDSLE